MVTPPAILPWDHPPETELKPGFDTIWLGRVGGFRCRGARHTDSPHGAKGAQPLAA